MQPHGMFRTPVPGLARRCCHRKVTLNRLPHAGRSDRLCRGLHGSCFSAEAGSRAGKGTDKRVSR